MFRVYSIHEIKNTLRPIFVSYGVRQAILFGSYAKGVATLHSDVDILVDSGLRGLAFFGLLESIRAAQNVSVDFIAVTQIEKGSQIETEIQRTGVLISLSYAYIFLHHPHTYRTPKRGVPNWTPKRGVQYERNRRPRDQARGIHR